MNKNQKLLYIRYQIGKNWLYDITINKKEQEIHIYLGGHMPIQTLLLREGYIY